MKDLHAAKIEALRMAYETAYKINLLPSVESRKFNSSYEISFEDSIAEIFELADKNLEYILDRDKEYVSV